MRLEARKYLHDIQQAAILLEQFTAGKQLDGQMPPRPGHPSATTSRSVLFA